MCLLESCARYPAFEFMRDGKPIRSGSSLALQGRAINRRLPVIVGIIVGLSCFSSLVNARYLHAKHHAHGVSRRSTDPVFGRPNAGAAHVNLKHTVWWRIATDRALDPYLLYAVALVESARVVDGAVAPWPWAVHRDGRTFYPETLEEAVAHMRTSISRGKPMIDLGLMQVNLRWHGHRVGAPEDLIDPLTNLHVGADILAESIASSPNDLVLGIGRYHSWKDPDAAYRYGHKVLLITDLIRPAL